MAHRVDGDGGNAPPQQLVGGQEQVVLRTGHARAEDGHRPAACRLGPLRDDHGSPLPREPRTTGPPPWSAGWGWCGRHRATTAPGTSRRRTCWRSGRLGAAEDHLLLEAGVADVVEPPHPGHRGGRVHGADPVRADEVEPARGGADARRRVGAAGVELVRIWSGPRVALMVVNSRVPDWPLMRRGDDDPVPGAVPEQLAGLPVERVRGGVPHQPVEADAVRAADPLQVEGRCRHPGDGDGAGEVDLDPGIQVPAVEGVHLAGSRRSPTGGRCSWGGAGPCAGR